MSKLLTITFAVLGFAAFCPHPASALIFSAPNPNFVYTDASGKKRSAEVVSPNPRIGPYRLLIPR